MHWEFIKELVCHFCRPEQCKPPWLGRLPVLATPGDKYFTPVSVVHVPHVTPAEECVFIISGLGMSNLIYTLKPEP